MRHKLYIDSVRKSFDLNRVLSDIYLSCQTGDIIGLLGKNGSGKSTLLKIIFGVLKADSKFIKLNSRRINSPFQHKGCIQYLPQQPFLPMQAKVRKIIELFCKPEQVVELSENALLKNILSQKVSELSGGEQRLLEVLLLIHSSSLFTLLDEPFNGIAPIHKEEVKACIRRESKNKGFILTDHDYRNIIAVSSRFVLLHDGGTKHLGNPEELVHWGYIKSLDPKSL